MRDILSQSPYLSQAQLNQASMVYESSPALSPSERTEMTVDLLQAFSAQLLNDEELHTFKGKH